MKKLVSLLCLLVVSFYTTLPSMAKLNKQSFTITRSNVELKSVIDSKYDAYEYTLKNHTKEKLLITNFVVDDGTLPNEAYANVKRNGWGAAGVTFVYGWNYAMATLGLSLVASVVACPFFVGASMLGNVGAKQEANRFSKSAKKFNNSTLENGFFKKKETAKFRVLAPQGTIPTVSIMLEDERGRNYIYLNSYFGTEFKVIGKPETENVEKKLRDLKIKTEEEVEIDDSVEQLEDNSKEAKNIVEQFETTEKKELPTEKRVPEAYKMYNTGVTLDPNIKTKQYFEENKNFTSF